MKKNTLLYIILFVLILMNGFFIYTFLNEPEQRQTGQKGNPTAFIAKELGFNEAQLEQLKIFVDAHRIKMRKSDHEINEIKDELFRNVFNPSVNQSTIDSLTTLIGTKEKEKDMTVFHHLKAIQDICNDSQKQRFQSILKDAMRPKNQRHRQGRPPPPPNH